MAKRIPFPVGKPYTIDTLVAQLRAYADHPPGPGEVALRDEQAEWMRAAAFHVVGVMCERDRHARNLASTLDMLRDFYNAHGREGWEDGDTEGELREQVAVFLAAAAADNWPQAEVGESGDGERERLLAALAREKTDHHDECRNNTELRKLLAEALPTLEDLRPGGGHAARVAAAHDVARRIRAVLEAK